MTDPASYRPAPGSIPTDPGVYRYLDPHGKVIYVGKAKNLRNRLNSYFADPASLHPRTQTMMRTAAKIEWTVVQNELESLQLEYTWIQLYKPRFNIMYRDNKSYPWLAVTSSDEFPRVFVGRGAKRKGWKYFGPFGTAWAVRDTLDTLLWVFPMRSCRNGVFNRAQASGRPCLFGYIGKCSAPCVGKISAEDHRQIVNDFCAFWAGKSNKMERKLTAQMEEASANLDFEQAAVLRDRISALRKATEKNAIVLSDDTDLDVINVCDDPLEIAVQIFRVRSGRVRSENSWVADRANDAPVSELLESFILQLYDDHHVRTETENIPPEILVPDMPPTASLLEELLSKKAGRKVRLHVPKRGQKLDLLDTVGKNAQQALARHKTKRASDLTTRSQALDQLQEALGLESAPLRIEGFDISHTQGQEVVASMVVFEDGLARKSEYKRFLIKSFEGSNDVAAMDEVLRRRLGRLLDDRKAMGEDETLIDPTTGAPRKFSYAPSLIVVDGGLPQINAAQEVLDDLGLSAEIMLIGLAKRLEEVWIPGEEFPVILPRNSEGLYLLQRVRDESHRFAITFHRSRRGKAMLESALDGVPGLGEVRRKTLIKAYPSMKKLRAASAEEIAELPGFGIKTAEGIVDALAAEPEGQSINMTTGEVT